MERIDGESTTIVGVMPAAFSSVFLWGPGDIFRPLALTDMEKANRDDNDLSLIGRYHSVKSLEQLNTGLGTLAARLAPLRSEAKSKDGLRAVAHAPGSLASAPRSVPPAAICSGRC